MINKYLGKFPIVHSSGHETQRILTLSDSTFRYDVGLSLIFHQEVEEFSLSAAIAHEGIDEHLIPRLILVRDIFNETQKHFSETSSLRYNIVKKALEEVTISDFTKSDRILPPRFYLSLDQQSHIKGKMDETFVDDFKPLYRELVKRISEKYGITNSQTEDDWLHEKRIILPVADGYSFEITIPTGITQTFEIHANSNVDYSRLKEFSEFFASAIRASLSEKVKLYDDIFTNCNFYINLDLYQQRQLTGEALEKMLLK